MQSREFFDIWKNDPSGELQHFFDTTTWGKLLAYTVKQSISSTEEECGRLKTIYETAVDTQGCKIATATRVATEKGQYFYYLVFGANQKIESFYADTCSGAPFYVPAETLNCRKQEVVVHTNKKIQLPGTLFLPVTQRPSPAVVLVHGSGPHDRNGSMLKNKIYLDMALGLVKKGIAVLIYDKRTYVYQFMNPFPQDSMTYYEETIEDALAAVKLVRKLKGIDSTKIYVAGHSQGAMCAPKIAELDARKTIKGLILLAAPARPLLEIIPEQLDYINGIDGNISEEERQMTTAINWQIKNALSDKLSLSTKSAMLPFGCGARYWLYDKNYKATETAKKLELPILLLQGGRDYNVTVKDYDIWINVMKDKANFSSKLYPELDHMYFTGKGKAKPADAARSSHVSEAVIKDMAEWIRGK
ncbi:MAG: alpha/beta hydrolase family protein [Bacteroidia bacterium]